MDADFVVVGGGIGGTVLAELLGRGGKRVLLLERSATPPNWVRPEILWPATAEVLFSLIPRESLEREALLPLKGIEVHVGQRAVASVSPEFFDEIRVRRWSADPNRTRERLLRLGAFELRRGVEVIAALKEKDRMVGVRTRDVASARERDILTPCTVGDDGSESVVRRACGLEMKTRLFPLDFLCFEFRWPATLTPATPRVWLNPNASASGIVGLFGVPLPGGRGAGLIVVRPQVFEGNASAEGAWKQFCGVNGAMNEVIGDRQFPRDFVRVRRRWGHARRYGKEGAILIGDAAHPVSPVGGQGANMSVADARALAEILLRGQRDLLEEYEARRRAANQRSLRFTQVAALALGLPKWCFPASTFFSLLPWVGRHPWPLGYLIRCASTAFQERPD